MKYFLNKLDKGMKKELEGKVTPLDKAVMKRCESGADILSIISCCKPYTDDGTKVFATTEEITKSVGKLVKLKVLRKG